jgi:hypothetical protein
VFRDDDIAAIADLVEGAAEGPEARSWTTSLTIDGREIPLNAFVQDILASGLLGMSSALQNVEGGDALEIRCRRRRG